jgi:hypothetical protein
MGSIIIYRNQWSCVNKMPVMQCDAIVPGQSSAMLDYISEHSKHVSNIRVGSFKQLNDEPWQTRKNRKYHLQVAIYMTKAP